MNTSALPYRDASLPTAERVADLLARMTTAEKVGQLIQYFHFGGHGLPRPDEIDIESIPEEYRPFLLQPQMVEAAIAEGRAGSALFIMAPALANTLQRSAAATRLGIPLLLGFDVIHGLRTIFPVPLALAATWDPSLVAETQAVAAREARAVGIHWAFAPMLDIARDPRWGRMIEGPGEDPYLASALAPALVTGFQGDHLHGNLGPENILAGPKHFAGYGAARGGRDYDDAEISDSELWNVYLPPFRAAVEAGAANVMSAYMDLNGVPASGNRWLLTDVLRGEFGFEGFVVSDANAVKSLETQHFAADQADAGVRALEAGMAMEMCMFDPAFGHLDAAVEAGRVATATLDEAVRQVLTAKFRLGLFERALVDEDAAEGVLSRPDHREVAARAAARTVVLLKNSAVLPLDPAKVQHIAVIGELADSRRDTLGPWVFAHDPDETVSIVDGLRRRLGAGVAIDHAPGASIPPRIFPSPFDRQEHTPLPEPVSETDERARIDAAVALAAAADVAIVVVGERQNQIGELASRSTLDLPGRQLEQLQRVVATGTPVVVLVMSGRPLDLQWADEHAAAIMQVWYPGTRGGDGVAAVLVGDESPAGRLPFTWPRHVGQVPMIYSHLRTFQPENQDKRYWNEPSTPLYPFGHGLGYATFAYENLSCADEHIEVGASTTIEVDVVNTSMVDSDDVVQLYVHQRSGTSSRPVRELKGFRRVHVGAGQRLRVSFTVGPEELTYWSAATRDWVQDATTIDIWVGGSSTADLATKFEVVRSAR